MKIVLTVLVMIVLAYIIMKKINPTLGLLVVGLGVLLAITTLTGTSLMGDSTSGNIYLDVLEYARSKFLSTFQSQGIILMPVFGYASYMTYLGASKKLAKAMIKPFKNIKSPYILVAISVIIAAILRVAIPSMTGLISLLMVTIYPVMVLAGMSKLSAAAAVVLGCGFDWGPADITTNLVLQNTTQEAPASFFAAYQLPIYAVGLVAAGIVLMLVNKWADQKMGYVIGSDTAEMDSADDTCPGFYALLPLIPLAIMIICSDVVLKNVSITPFSAVLLSFLVVIVVEIIRKKSLIKAFNESKEFFTGMGVCYTGSIALVSAAGVFGDALTKIGGFDQITTAMQSANLPAFLSILVIIFLSLFMTFFTASTVPATVAFSPLIPGIASTAGLVIQSVMLPCAFAMGIARAFSPVSAANIFTSDYINKNGIDLVKRNALPMLSAILAILVASLLFIH